jgi:NTP pyrophosphatase (non-canonical NTP hydrolase)
MVMKSLNELRDMAFAYAEKQGFHERQMNLGERLMLVVSELSEALEADRKGKRCTGICLISSDTRLPTEVMSKEFYEAHIRGTIEEELADAIIRIADIAGICKIDLDWHVAAKMAYNETRPRLHGKNYG